MQTDKILRWVNASERNPPAGKNKWFQARWLDKKDVYGEKAGFNLLCYEGLFLVAPSTPVEGRYEWLEEIEAPAASPVMPNDSEAYQILKNWMDMDKAVDTLYNQGVMSGSAFIQAEHDLVMAKQEAQRFLKSASPVIEREGKHFGASDTESLIQSIFVTLTENVKDYNTERLFKTAQLIGLQWAGMMDAVYEGAAQWESRCLEAEIKLAKLTETKASPLLAIKWDATAAAWRELQKAEMPFDPGPMGEGSFYLIKGDAKIEVKPGSWIIKDEAGEFHAVASINLPSNEGEENNK